MPETLDEAIARMLAECRAQLGERYDEEKPPEAALLSVLGRVDADKPPEIAERIKQTLLTKARKSHRGKGRPATKLERGEFAEQHGIAAAMRKYNIERKAAQNNRSVYRAYKKSGGA